MLSRHRLALSVALVLLVSIPPALAESTGDVPESIGEQYAVAFAEDLPGQPLSINQAIALGLRNNLDVEVNRYTPYTSQLDSEAAWGAYDPTFTGTINFDDAATRNTFSLDNALLSENEQFGGEAKLRALIPYWGASFELGYDGVRSVTNNSLIALSPEYQAGVTIGGTIPLMRGLIWNQAWTQVKTSRLAYDAELDNFTTTVMDIVQGIISSYWNLVATKEQVYVEETSLKSNQALLDQTKVQYDVGVVSRVEVVQAEAGVANSEFNLIVARNTYRNAQDTLIAAVLGDRLRADTTLLFDPSDSPEFTRVEPVDLNQAVQTAFAKRPELAAVERRLDQGEIQLKFAKNQRLPQVDLTVSYRTFGVEGSQNPRLYDFNIAGPAVPGTVREGTYSDTSNSFFRSRSLYPNEVRALGVISIPLGNITARKNVTKAQIELRRANSQITRLKQQIIVSVRSAARGLLASAQGVEAAERRREAAAEQLRAEKIRLEHGESTPFDVLLRQTDLVDAESQKIFALQAFRNSQAALEREQGTILDAWDVVIDSVRALDYQDALQIDR